MIDPNDIRIGSIFKKDGRVWKVLDKRHVKLSKGGACQQVKCVDLINGSTVEMRLNVNETLEEAFLNKETLTFSYSSGNVVTFLNNDYSGVELSEADLGILYPLFQIESESMPKVELGYLIEDNGNRIIVSVKLLEDIVLQVVQTADSIKGETATSADKPAVLEGGVKTKVPSHVNNGDRVILSKVDLSYISKKI